MTAFKELTAYSDAKCEWMSPTYPYDEENAQLKAENAKLRELVAEMFNACPMCVNCAHNHLTVGWYDRMRELGVEV